jgi:hypothetical protein
MTTEQRIIVKETNLQRLQRMLEHHVVGRDSETADMLEAELAWAEGVRPDGAVHRLAPAEWADEAAAHREGDVPAREALGHYHL